MLVSLLYFGGSFVLALALGLYLTPLIRRGAISFGVLDQPDGDLKRQVTSVPYLGGVAVYLAFLITLCLVFDFDAQLLGLLLGGTMLAMLGLFDDLHVLEPRLKLAGQLLAVWVLVRSDVSIQLISVPEAVALPLTVFWLVGITNAVNILDVSDGLAAGVAAIAGCGLFVIAAVNGETVIAVATLALVGSIIGFLRYNQAPASIYLGDTGSLFVGFMLGALAIVGAYTQRNEVAALAPVAILGVPILETILVVVARLARGTSPLRGSNDHMALRLKARGWSSRRIALFAYGLGTFGSAAGVTAVLTPEKVALGVLGAAGLVGLITLFWLWRMPRPGAVAHPGALPHTAGTTPASDV